MAGPIQIQKDNVDVIPARPSETPPWTTPHYRARSDWRVIAICWVGGLVSLLLAWWIVGDDVRAWVRYSDGALVVRVLVWGPIVGAAAFGVRKLLLLDQPGGFKLFAWQVAKARGETVISGALEVQRTYAGTPFRQVGAYTLTNPAPPPPQIEEAEVIEASPDVGPLPIPLWLARLDDEPHAIFAAKTKGGKSTMARVGLKPRIERGESIFVIDPHANGWLDLPGVGGGLNWPQVEDAIACVTQLYADRHAERARYIRETGQELPHTYFPRLTVILDEANEARTKIEQRHTTKKSPWQPFMEVMGSGSRKVGISLWLICQSSLIKDLGGSTMMRRNFTVFALDHATIRELIESEEPMPDRRQAVMTQIGGAAYPAATVLAGQAFLLDRTNINQLEPQSASGCAWVGWDYARGCPTRALPAPTIQIPSRFQSVGAKAYYLGVTTTLGTREIREITGGDYNVVVKAVRAARNRGQHIYTNGRGGTV